MEMEIIMQMIHFYNLSECQEAAYGDDALFWFQTKSVSEN